MNKCGVTVILLLILCASALAADFEISGSETSDLLRCVQTREALLLTNVDSLPGAYSITLDAPPWVAITPETATLDPGASIPINLTYDTPCDAKGTSRFSFIVDSDDGISKPYVQTMAVGVPQNLELEAINYSSSVKPCQATWYKARLTNPSPFTENYDITFISPSKLALELKAHEKRVTLAGNESRDLVFDVIPRDCTQSGDATLVLRVESGITALAAEMDFSLSIRPEGIASIAAPQRIVTGYRPSIASVNIANNGATTTTYAVTVSGASWAKANVSTLTLAPDETQPVVLVLTPVRDSVRLGDYTLTVSAKPAGSDANYAKDITLRVYEPSWLKTQFTDHLGRTVLILLGALILLFIIIWLIGSLSNHYNSEEYARKKEERATLRAQRKEERRKERELAEKERIAAIEATRKEEERLEKERQKEIQIKQQEKERAERERITAQEKLERERKQAQEKLERERQRETEKRQREQAAIDKARQKEAERKKREEEKRTSDEFFARATSAAERDLRKTYVLVHKRELQDKDPRKRFWWLVLLLFLIVAAAIVSWAFYDFWAAYALHAIVGAGAALLLVIILLAYEWSRSRTARSWRLKPLAVRKKTLLTHWKAGLVEITLKAEEVIADCIVAARRSKKPLDCTPPEEQVYDYFSISGNGIDDKSLEALSVRFALGKAWLRKNGIDPAKVRLVRYDEGWKGTSVDMVGEDKKNVFYSASPGCFGTFAITGKAGSSKEPLPAPLPWPLILAVLILIVIIGGSYAISTLAPAPYAPVAALDGEGIPPQYWPSNTAHTLNISAVFSDPDGDPLRFTYTPVKDIVVTVKDGTATFLPDKDFTGERTITFTASDGKGGAVTSNAVTLVVYARPVPTPLEEAGSFFKDNILFIIVAAVVVVGIILLMEYRTAVKRFLDED